MSIIRIASAALAAALFLSGCSADPTRQLEKVAKDWSLTIRASQVIPVYPLSEDIQPGDIMLVPTSISTQTDEFKEKGFLPTDQLVARLQDLNYKEFYRAGYWKGDYAAGPFDRKPTDGETLRMPRAAFPTYSFSVDTSVGLALALPIQGIPVGLGLMNASKASGTVTISDAHTYGVESAYLYGRLVDWYNSDPNIGKTFEAMAKASEAAGQQIYLRMVTRVFLTGSVDVTLINARSTSGGADIGAAKPVPLADLSSDDPAKVKGAAAARKEALEALSSELNINAAMPGGSIRFTNVTQRSVSLKQKFDRPLVIGFRGFDVRVFNNGKISAPIPSWSVLNGDNSEKSFAKSEFTIKYCAPTPLMKRYRVWIAEDGNRSAAAACLKTVGYDRDPSNLGINCELNLILDAASKNFSF